jgi:hypothetical protein
LISMEKLNCERFFLQESRQWQSQNPAKRSESSQNWQ